MTRSEIIDELGPLEEWHAGIKTKLDRRDALRDIIRGGGPKKLVGWPEVDERPVAAAVQYDGGKYQVQLSERAMQGRIPSLLKVYQKIGSLKFIQHVSMALGTLRELIPTADDDGLIVTDQSGPRKITAVVSLKAGGRG